MNIEYSNEDESQPTFSPDEWERLVHIFDAEALWRWLKHDEQRALLLNIARGFQVSPRALRQPLVKKRLAQTLARESEIADKFLQAWRATKPIQKLFEALAGIEDEAALQEQRAHLEREHGADALHFALKLDGRFEENNEVRGVELSKVENKQDVEQDAVHAQEKARWQEQLSSVRAKLRKAETELAQSRKAEQSAKHNAERAQSERDQSARWLEKRQDEFMAQTAELRAQLERLSRKHRALETAHEEQTAEIKRLQRLVRQSQRLAEEQRRHNATLTLQLSQRDARALELQAQLETYLQSLQNAPATKPKPVAPSRPLIAKTKANVPPHEQFFVWNADGHEVRVSPREVKEKVERNDEAQVARWVQALDALQDHNAELHRTLLRRLRDHSRYAHRVLTQTTLRVLVDASNVARHEKDARGRGQLRTLLAMRDELRRHDFFPIVLVADASLPYNIDEAGELSKMIARGEVGVTPAGVEADDVLARESRRSGAYVVTNDRNFQRRVAPDWEPPRIGFNVRDGVVELGEW